MSSGFNSNIKFFIFSERSVLSFIVTVPFYPLLFGCDIGTVQFVYDVFNDILVVSVCTFELQMVHLLKPSFFLDDTFIITDSCSMPI